MAVGNLHYQGCIVLKIGPSKNSCWPPTESNTFLFSKRFSRSLYTYSSTGDTFLHIRSRKTWQVLYFKSWHRLEYKYLKFLWFCLFLSLCKLMIITGALRCEVYLRKTSLQKDKQKENISSNWHHIPHIYSCHTQGCQDNSWFCLSKRTLVVTIRVTAKLYTAGKSFHHKIKDLL